VLRGGHSRKGEAGTITNNPGRVFNGWAIRIDGGLIVGAGDWHLMKEASNRQAEQPRSEANPNHNPVNTDTSTA
jgi:hypothetical protein